jgi:hypothetical protein
VLSGLNLGHGGAEFEEIQVAVYPRSPAGSELESFFGWYFGYKAETWHGLPAVGFDSACREGDTPIICPGRTASEVIADRRVFYELSA